MTRFRARLIHLISFTVFVVLINFAIVEVTAQKSSRTTPRRQGAEKLDRRVDDPADEDELNRELWQFAKHTPYQQMLHYVAAEQRKSQSNKVSEVELPNGWRIAPAGNQIEVGRLPYEAIRFAGKIVVLNTGYYYKEDQEVSVVDLESGRVEKTLKFHSLFPSATIGPDGDLYISGGFDQKIFRVDKQFNNVREYAVNGFAGGVAALDAQHLAFGCMALKNSKGTYINGELGILNTSTGKVEMTTTTGYFPFAIRHIGDELFVTLLGENKLLAFTTTLKPVRTIVVGQTPQEMCTDGRQIYVINTNSDSLSVIDVSKNRVSSTIQLATPNSKFGTTPTSCALDDRRLFVTLAGNNSLLVLDRQSGRRLNEIPTGWYPTKVIADGDQILTLSAKGIKPRHPNPNGPSPAANSRSAEYVLNLLKGTLGVIKQTDMAADARAWKDQVDNGSPVFDRRQSLSSPIKHIFYIIKENRTYDQVLGDLPKANGDPRLTIFGDAVTPVQHQLAREFVTLDNFYANGEISVLGHSFTTSGYASPFSEWLGNVDYSQRWKGYPFGTVPSTMSPVYLWDLLEDRDIDYRIYGENYFLFTRAYRIFSDKYGADSPLARRFYDKTIESAAGTDRGQEFNNFAGEYYGRANSPEDAYQLLGDAGFLNKLSQFLTGDESFAAAIRKDDSLRRRFAEYLARYPSNFRSWDLKVSDMDRLRAWKIDFETQLRAGKVAQLNYIWLPNDHTDGSRTTILNPYQFVAQNDSALGRMIEIISHSAIWKDSLILVVEDDAQNGPDHVDATRTTAFAAGPYVKRGAIVSDRYDQISMLRTIELLLGLRSVNAGEQLAAPMFGIFTDKPDFRPFVPPPHSKHLAASDREKLAALR